MWQRIKRFFRSLFGGALDAVEDPELILKQSIRDMRDRLGPMNDGLAKMKGAVILLQQEIERYKTEEAKNLARMKAGLEAGEEELAASYAVQLKQTQTARARSEEQLAAASSAYENAVQLKKDYVRQMEVRTREALQAIREAQASKWKSEVASVFESFQVGDLSATHDEMIDKLRQKNAMAEGRLAMAGESVDMEKIKLEKRAEELEAKAILEQMKIEMGLTTSPVTKPTEEAAKTLGQPESTATS